MEVSCIAIGRKLDYHKNVNRKKNTARTNGEAHGTEKESGCDHPRSISGGDLTGQLEAGTGAESGRAGGALRRQSDPHPAGPETDAYPRHGGLFQQGTLLRAHLQ